MDWKVEWKGPKTQKKKNFNSFKSYLISNNIRTRKMLKKIFPPHQKAKKSYIKLKSYWLIIHIGLHINL